MIRPASCEAALARIHLAAATAAEHELRQSVIAAGLQASQVRFSLARARRRTDQARERLAQAEGVPASRHRA